MGVEDERVALRVWWLFGFEVPRTDVILEVSRYQKLWTLSRHLQVKAVLTSDFSVVVWGLPGFSLSVALPKRRNKGVLQTRLRRGTKLEGLCFGEGADSMDLRHLGSDPPRRQP